MPHLCLCLSRHSIEKFGPPHSRALACGGVLIVDDFVPEQCPYKVTEQKIATLSDALLNESHESFRRHHYDAPKGRVAQIGLQLVKVILAKARCNNDKIDAFVTFLLKLLPVVRRVIQE